MAARGIPVGDLLVAIVIDDARPRYVYQDGKRTDQRVLDENGSPLTALSTVVGSEAGLVSDASVYVPDALVTDVSAGDVVALTGDLTIDVTGTREAYETRSVIQGVHGLQSIHSLPLMAQQAGKKAD